MDSYEVRPIFSHFTEKELHSKFYSLEKQQKYQRSFHSLLVLQLISFILPYFLYLVSILLFIIKEFLKVV